MYIAGGELFASHGTWQMQEFADTAPPNFERAHPAAPLAVIKLCTPKTWQENTMLFPQMRLEMTAEQIHILPIQEFISA